VDKMLTRVSSDFKYIGNVHRAEELITDATTFYESLLCQSEDPQFVLRAVTAYRRAAFIRELGGLTDKKEPALRRASELLSQLVEAEPDRAAYRYALASNELALAKLLWLIDQRAQVEVPLQHSISTLEELTERFPQESDYQLRLAQAYNELGRLNWHKSRPQNAEAFYTRCAQIIEQLPPEFIVAGFETSFYTSATARGYRSSALHALRGALLNNRALLARDRSDFNGALELVDEALASLRSAHRESGTSRWLGEDFLLNFWSRGDILNRAGRHQEAAAAVEKFVWTIPAYLSTYHEGAVLLIRCADICGDGDLQDGIQLKRTGAAPVEAAKTDQAGAATANDKPRPPPAPTPAAYRQRARELLAKARKVPCSCTVTADHLAWFWLTCPDESFRDPQQALELAQSVTAAAPERLSAWRTLSLAHYRLGQWDKAELALQTVVSRSDDSLDVTTLYLRAMIDWQLGNHADARQTFDRAKTAIASNDFSDAALTTLSAEAAALLHGNK
jgi:tetratricopeptide (TPR) repeat protein